MLPQEIFQLLFAENITTSTFIFFPIFCILIRIIPKQISNETTIRNVCRFCNLLNLFKRGHVFWNSTMHTHNFFINECHYGHMIETIVELLPQSHFISSLNLIKKSVKTCDSLTFVVSSQYNDLFRIANFQSK